MWAARELGQADPFGLVPEDWAWWLRNFRAHDSCIGWPRAAPSVELTEADETDLRTLQEA